MAFVYEDSIGRNQTKEIMRDSIISNEFSREFVMERIEKLCEEFIQYLTNGKIFSMKALKRSTSNMFLDENYDRLLHNQTYKDIKLTRNSARKYTAIWLVLQTIYSLLLTRKTATQREIYYLHPFFLQQQEADEAILDAGSILGVPRGNLNIVGATKGCFTGRMNVLLHSQWHSYINGMEIPITQDILQLQPHEIQSDAKYIVVIEKDGIFNRLREDKFYNQVPSILITGRGYPDLATRMFIYLLYQILKIPVIGLCDCNPYGLSILLTYKLGSARMPLETKHYSLSFLHLKYFVAVDIKWIGLRPSHVQALNLPQNVFQELTKKDTAMKSSIGRSPYIQKQLQYQKELDLWGTSLPWKIELEALHYLGFNYIGQFLEQAILDKNYI